MGDTSDERIALLENYLLQDDKDNFFASLVKNSDTYLSMKTLYLLNKHGLEIPAESASEVQQFLNKKNPGPSERTIQWRHALLQIENEKDQAKQKALLQKFNKDYLHHSFSYQKPADVKNATQFSTSLDSRNPKVLDEKMFDLEQVINKFYEEKGWTDIKLIQRENLISFDLNRLLDKHIECFKFVIERIPNYLHIPTATLVKVMVKYCRLKTKTKKSTYHLPLDILGRMTLSQIEAFLEGYPVAMDDANFLQILFEKTFSAEIEILTDDDSNNLCDQERKNILLKMEEQALKLVEKASKSVTAYPKVLLVKVQRNILEIDVRLNTLSKERFIKYLESPLNQLKEFKNQYFLPNDPFAKGFLNSYSNYPINEDELVRTYLSAFLKEMPNTGEFEKIFENNYLMHAFYKSKIHNGENIDNITRIFSESTLNKMCEEKILQFEPWNKKAFTLEDTIDLSLKIKNIQKLEVNIFEINTESYYRKNKQEVNHLIDLSGLIPTLSKKFTLDAKPILIQTIEYKDLFPTKRGVFVVEFIGGGLSSRALINIGALSLVRQTLSKGILLHIIDDDKKICSSPSTTLFFKGTIYRPDSTLDGGILIPYSSKTENEKAILTHEGFSQIKKLKIPAENIKFNFWLGFNEEEISTQKPVTLTASLNIFCNNQFVSPSVLKGLKAEISTKNDLGVANSAFFENLEVSNGATSITFTPQPKTQIITVELSAKIWSMAQEKDIDLYCTQHITLDRFSSSKAYYDLYLSQEGDQYVLNFLGKNGEPYCNKMVTLSFETTIFCSEKTQSLETDSEGKIRLGKLKNVNNIRMVSMDNPCSVSPSFDFKFVKNDKIAALPGTIDIAEGEDICLPFAGLAFDAANYQLIQRDKSSRPLKDFKDSITHEDGMIYLNKLPMGVYDFFYLAERKNIKLCVQRGHRWSKSPLFLLKENSIAKMMNQSLYLTYKNFNHAEGKIRFRVLSNNMRTVQVHAMAFNYCPKNLSQMKRLLKSCSVVEYSEEFCFDKKSNTYLSEKSMSSELKYVLERKSKTNMLGNTLDKPSCLLKRHPVRETSQNDQVLNQEQPYRKQVAHKASKNDSISESSVGLLRLDYKNINCLNTFLGQPGWSKFNILPDENGDVVFEIPEKASYGSLVFIIKDSRNSIIETLPLESGEKKRVDIRLDASKTANKVYLYERLVHKLAKEQECTIKDLAATEMNVVDSMGSLMKIFKILAPTQRENFYEEWSFLSKWNTLTPEEQLKKYDKYMSHELNLFVYFKDRDFFDAVVKNHLKSKSTKTLIDHFLLDEEEPLTQYLNGLKISGLSILEKALLVTYFVKKAPLAARAIAANIKHAEEAKEKDITMFKQKFDSVLKAKSAQPTENAEPIMAMSNFAGPPAAMNNNNVSNFGMSNCMPMMQQAYVPPMSNIVPPTPPRRPVVQSRGRGGRYAGMNTRQLMNQCYNQIENEDEDCFDEEELYENEDEIRMGLRQECQQMSFGNRAMNLEQIESSLNSRARAGQLESHKYRTIGVTKEYIERQFFFDPTSEDALYGFWKDYVEHVLEETDKPFLSGNFIYCGNHTNQLVAMLALIDLPFEEQPLKSEVANNQMKIMAQSNCMVFSKEIQEKGDQKLDLEILISQRFCDPTEKYIVSSDGRSKTLKVVNEFLVGTLYSSRIAVTNTSESQQEINIVTEVPQGSIPVLSLEYMKSTSVNIDPLTTHIVEIFFYFPAEGEFTCYPASINKDGCLVTSAAAIPPLKVVKTYKPKEMKTMKDILSLGTKSDILQFMEKENLQEGSNFDFSSIYWLLNDEDFYKKVIELLRRKMIFEPTVWEFSIKHGDFKTFAEIIQHRINNQEILGDNMNLRYLKTDEYDIDLFEFKEYNPLINARVHDIGQYRHKILNEEFKQTYLNFLNYLTQKPSLASRDYLLFCTYLVMQDRIEEALDLLDRIKGEELAGEMKLQHDYLLAFLDLSRDFPHFTKAKEICSQYLTYPVFTWRNKFIDLINQISEFDGETELLDKIAEETAGEKNERQSKSEPHLSTKLENKTLTSTFKNIDNITLKFFKIDLEVVFSQSPFLSANQKDYSCVIPNKTLIEKVEKTSSFATLNIDVPEELKNDNLIIQASSEELSEELTYFPSSMKVQVIKNFGQVKVFSQETNRPLSNIYVKCFSKNNNNKVFFYKDGYTDLRGTFEYASLNSGDLGSLKSFSLLIISDKQGAVIKETEPPASVQKTEVSAAQIISKNFHAYQSQAKKKCANKYMCV